MLSDFDLRRLASRVGRAYEGRAMFVATAESCTGGFIAKVVTDTPGSSNWFKEGFVTYSNHAKVHRLQVLAHSLNRYGAVSEQVARLMARGALRRAKTDVAVAVTGIAGPGGAVPGKPVGTVWVAWAARRGRGVRIVAKRYLFRGNRDAVRRKSVHAALLGLLREIFE